MIDFEAMVTSLRLTWLERIFGEKKLHTSITETVWCFFSYFTVATMQRTSLFAPSSIPNYFNGGLNFEPNLMQEKVGKILFGTIKKY